jgi:uncharacterized protein (DUF697 family)
MNKFVQLAEKFEKLLSKLPGAIQKPIQKEWRPLKELFIQRRPPRLLVVGQDAEAFIRTLFHLTTDVPEGPDAWRTYEGDGKIQFITAEERPAAAKAAIMQTAPDIFLFLGGVGATELLQDLHSLDRERYKSAAPIVGCGSEPSKLSELLHSNTALSENVEAVVSAGNREVVLSAIAKVLPDEARLEFARASGEKAVQKEIASTLTRSVAAVCGAIGAQPIPLADFPILTTLQVLLISGIIHVSGRQWSMKLARDFLAALGANIGIGLVFREGARAAVKLLPGWGNAISGAVAAAGTYAVGRAGTAYFIEGVSMEQARQTFKRDRKKALPPGDERKR